MSATMTRQRAFEIRGGEWIVRPWETTLRLPGLDEPFAVPQEIMGIPCALGSWLYPFDTLAGIVIAFRNGWLIEVALLPGDPLDRVEAMACLYDEASDGTLVWPSHDTPPDYDAMELLALIRAVAGWPTEE
jgi:hypothetical protein